MTMTINKEVLKVFDKLEKLNPEAKFLSESALSTVNSWIDTGCMVLNSIISGSLYGGVPVGRITGFAGPSAAGKTYIIKDEGGAAGSTINRITVSVDGPSGDTIDGQASVVISSAHGAFSLYSDGSSNWYVC